MNHRPLGAKIQPFRGIHRIAPMLGASPLPEQYIVPAFRHIFDADFKVIPAEAVKFIKDQGQRPSCVGQSAAYQKESQEGVPMSGLDIYRQSKQKDGTDPLAWGTTLVCGQDAVASGACEYSLAPEVAAMTLQDYVYGPVTPEQAANRLLHKGARPFTVTRNQFFQTLFQFETPIQTSLHWNQSDNDIGSDGVMPPISGKDLGGHALCCIGWVTRNGIQGCPVLPNSFGTNWGDHGFLYAPPTLLNRFTDGLVAVDLPHDLTEVLAKYNGHDVQVQGDPKVYHVEFGIRRHYTDEITFWAMDRIFSEVVDISAPELALIPEGPPIVISEATFRNTELVREIRQHYGQN